MALPPGTKLGPYEVLAPIDSGVTEPDDSARYKASDTRADKIVALKLLTTDLATPETKARLERDSRTISSLNHPNIAALLDVGHEAPSTHFVVGEFVEGESLAERLKRGPLPLPEAMAIAIAVADSLDKAHRKGMIHGGLNPTTIVLSASGPKLLDFGVARIKDENSSAVSASSMIATRAIAPALSAAPAFAMPYLSPEQIAGSPADARSDIFSFGVVLYEVITGHPAFREKTVALLMAAIQSVEPEATTKIQRAVPPALDHVIQRCLAKDPRQRLQTAWDLLTQLRWIAEGGSQIGIPVAVVGARAKSSRALWAATAVVALAAAAMAPSAWSRWRPAPAPPPVRFLAEALPQTVTPVLVSPDGRWLATARPGITGAGMYALPLNGVGAELHVKDNIAYGPFFSADSKSLAFMENGQLKRVEFAGGPARSICEVSGDWGLGAWGSRGDILFSANGVIYRVSATGGQPAAVSTPDKAAGETDHLAPFFLPDGRHFLYLVEAAKSSGIYLGDLDSTTRTRLFDAANRPEYSSGYILYTEGPTLFARPFDDKALQLTGDPVRVADNLYASTANVPGMNARLRGAAFAVSDNGVLSFRIGPGSAAATTSSEEQRTLFVLDRGGVRGMPLGPTGGWAGIDLSPDGKRLALHRHEGAGGDSWILDIEQNRMQRLTFDAAQDNSSPIWSPDGTKIAFVSNRKNKWGIYIKPADGTGAEELITESEAAKQTMAWSPDGKLLVYRQTGLQGDLWAVPVAGDRKPFALIATPASEDYPSISSDGKWIAYMSNETNRAEIYIKPFPEGPGKWQVSTDGGQWPRWRADGKELYFNGLGPPMMSAEIKVTGTSLQAGVPQSIFTTDNPNVQQQHGPYHRYAVSADGGRFYISQPGAGAAPGGGGISDQLAAVADGQTFASGNNNLQKVSVILNWPQLIKK